MAESGQVLAAALAQEGLASGAGVGQVLAAGVLEVTLEVSAAGAAGRPPQAWRAALGLMLEESIGKRRRSRQWQHEVLPYRRCLQGKFQAKPEGMLPIHCGGLCMARDIFAPSRSFCPFD